MISAGLEQQLLQVLNAVCWRTGTSLRGQPWADFAKAWWGKVVLDLEVEVPTEPAVEEELLHVAGGCQLAAEPVTVGLLVHLHDDVIHLCDPHKPVALQEADEVEEKGWLRTT